MASRVINQPLEPILHPSVWRLRWVGLFSLVGYPIFWWIWSYLQPQPWESALLRFSCAGLGLFLLVGYIPNHLEERNAKLLFNLVCWLQLPLFFTWMLLANQANAVWLSSYCAMLLIYFHLVDWRFATIGALVGGIGGSVVYMMYVGFDIFLSEPVWTLENSIVIAFTWLTGLALGFSSSNMRTAHLKQTLSTMGILAHELRTPIASVALMGDVLSDSVQEVRTLGAEASADRLAFLSSRLDALVRMMNYHIDMQIANARQFLPQTPLEPLLASTCLKTMLADYPFINDAQRRLVNLEVRNDFVFLGVHIWMIQIFNNLMKNALYAMAAKQTRLEQDAVRLVIDLDAHSSFGCLQIIDCGTGISSAAQKNVFQPFYSSQRGSSHGLGLAYCQRTVHALRGTIHLSSELGAGTTITLQFPILTSQESNAHHGQF
ncbi:MAG: hypothetical protein RL761_662 [Pseudomonadota bacterium]